MLVTNKHILPLKIVFSRLPLTQIHKIQDLIPIFIQSANNLNSPPTLQRQTTVCKYISETKQKTAVLQSYLQKVQVYTVL